jgi:hypothetical protein
VFFDYLAAHARDPFGVGNGVGALDAAFQWISPETLEGGAMVTPYLYLDFAFNFAPPIAAVAYARAKGRAPVTLSVQARARSTVKRLTLNGMSAHFIAISVPRGARALELVTTGVDGPDPLQTLLVGVRRGKTRSLRSLRVVREVNPCVVTFRPAYGSFVDRITVNFRSDRERRGSVLVVANRTGRTVGYTLAYRTLGAPEPKPSPSVPWGKPVAPTAETFCQKDVVGVTGSDPAGDAELGAPELTELVASLVTTSSNSRPLVAFVLDVPNRRELQAEDYVTLWIDTDQNSSTGCAPYGAERVFVIRGLPLGPDAAGFGRCSGGEMPVELNRGTFQARFDEVRRRLLILTTTSDLGGATAFNFRFDAWWREAATGEIRIDSVPDGPFVACFPRCTGGSRARLR